MPSQTGSTAPETPSNATGTPAPTSVPTAATKAIGAAAPHGKTLKRRIAGYLAACVAFFALLCVATAAYAPDRAYAEEDRLHIVFCYDGLAEDCSYDTYQHVKLPGPPEFGIYVELNERIEGWYLDREYTQPAEFGRRVVKSYEVLTLYPKWKPVPVTYNYGGVKPTEQFPSNFPGAIFDPLKDTPPAGKTHDAAYDEHILGWYWDPACTDECDMSENLRTVIDPVLYAKWDTKIVFSFGESMESVVRDWSLVEPPESPFVIGWRVYDGTGTPQNFDYLQPTVAATQGQTYHYVSGSDGKSELTVFATWDTATIAKAIADQNDPAQAAPYRFFDPASHTMKLDAKRGLWKISNAYMPTIWHDEQTLSRSWYLPNPGWYVLVEDVAYDEPIFIKGDVHLILKDGCTITANQGIVVENGSSFSVYGNSTDEEIMGSLVVTGSMNEYAGIGGGGWRSGSIHAWSGDITIHGGNISATSTGGGAGIGGGVMGWPGLITINGGNVTAEGSGDAAGIGGGDSARLGEKSIVTINGGTIRAITHGSGSGAIGASAESMFGPHEYTIRVADGMFIRVGERGPESTVTDLSQAETALNNARFAWVTERSSFAEGDLHMVTFVAEGANPIPPQEVEHNGRLVPPSITVPGAISVTVRWYTDKACTHEWDAENDQVTADFTLYAAWEGQSGGGGGTAPADPGASDNTGDSGNAGDNQAIPQTGDSASCTLAILVALMLGGFAATCFARRAGRLCRSGGFSDGLRFSR